jgi:amino-acid N-acetyltransferase
MTNEGVAGSGCVTVRSARKGDLDEVQDLLAGSGLPLDGVGEWLPRFLVAEHEGRLIATAGLEVYESSALLRSVAVEPSWRGTGLGRRLIDDLLGHAKAQGIDDVYLLTTTAEHYFPRLGFACITRAEVPTCVQASAEFQGACPSSAVVMRRELAPS